MVFSFFHSKWGKVLEKAARPSPTHPPSLPKQHRRRTTFARPSAIAAKKGEPEKPSPTLFFPSPPPPPPSSEGRLSPNLRRRRNLLTAATTSSVNTDYGSPRRFPTRGPSGLFPSLRREEREAAEEEAAATARAGSLPRRQAGRAGPVKAFAVKPTALPPPPPPPPQTATPATHLPGPRGLLPRLGLPVCFPPARPWPGPRSLRSFVRSLARSLPRGAGRRGHHSQPSPASRAPCRFKITRLAPFRRRRIP